MNLLTDSWIPVRQLSGGSPQRINLQTLLREASKWTLNLPRDDMELAVLQLLICLLQVTWIPKNNNELRLRISEPLPQETFLEGIETWSETFRLDHPNTPFMQVKDVKAKEITGMDKLLAGLTGATNCTFVNEPGQGDALCAGCSAIALFNQANNVPSFGGGFKAGLRSESPVTTLIQGNDLRTTLWLNVLTEENLDKHLPWWREYTEQPPTWQQPIKESDKIPAASLGLLRGLFWQPDHIELCLPAGEGQCTGCGFHSDTLYHGFYKAKFKFTIEGIWPHPHSPRIQQVKKGQLEEKFLAFTTSIPSWTQINRMLIAQTANKQQQGHQVAPVLTQIRALFPGNQLRLVVGGYCNKKASILERRHEVLAFNQGWEYHLAIVDEIVTLGESYKAALWKALNLFAQGIKKSEVKGAGISIQKIAEQQYYRQSDILIPEVLASIDFQSPENILTELRGNLHQLCLDLFERHTAPYIHHPKLAVALAHARRNLNKSLSELKPQGGQQDGEAA